jgi:UDP-glucose 4-epimerase
MPEPMRVLVTGGAGFIGSHIVDRLLSLGHEVSVLDNLSTGKRENVAAGAKLFVADLRDRDAVARVLAEARPEAVTHQAAQASVAISVRDPRLDAEINVIGGINLLDAAVDAGVKRFVFASTGGAIYGEVPPPVRAKESTPPVPVSPYAIHKLCFEQLLGVYQRYRGLPVTVLRYANVYGPRQDPHGEAGVVAIFFQLIRDGKPLGVNAMRAPGDDGCIRDYVYVDDVVRMNVLALTGEVKDPVVNVGTGEATTTRALALAMLRVAGREVPLEDRPMRAGDVERSLLDPTLVQGYLKTLTQLDAGLAATAPGFR